MTLSAKAAGRIGMFAVQLQYEPFWGKYTYMYNVAGSRDLVTQARYSKE